MLNKKNYLGLVSAVILAFIFIAQGALAEQYVLKIKAKDKFERTAIIDAGVSIEEVGKDYVLVYASDSEKANLEKMGVVMSSRLVEQKLSSTDFPAGDGAFHDYKRTMDELKRLSNENPKTTKLFSIGKSFEGRDILGIEICGDMANAHLKPAIAFMGGHHSREHVSVEMPLALARYILEQYNSGNERITRLINSRDIQIVPAVNPDGLEYDIATGTYQSWRKNRRSNGDGTYGVDLNRNYGYKWGTGGSSTNTSSDVYMGPTPFSEPETQAVKNWIESNKNISTLLTFHTFSELILYPWGHKFENITDKRDLAVFKTMAQKMAGWNQYTPQQSSELYIASGDTTDWAYGEHKIISFTFELDPSSMFEGGFYPGAKIVPGVIAKNIEPALYLIEYADDPYRVLSPSISSPSIF